MMKCQRQSCGHEWEPRKRYPKCCPKCKQYINWESMAVNMEFDAKGVVAWMEESSPITETAWKKLDSWECMEVQS